MDVPSDLNADAPDWSTLEFDVTCPRCAYNLKMLALPRCPECGLTYEWPAVVEASRQAAIDSPLFEYRWRRKPIGSLAYTLLACLFPRHLWRRARLTDTPRPRVLLMLALLVLVLFTVLHWLTLVGEAVFANWSFATRSLSTFYWLLPRVDWIGPMRNHGLLLPILVGAVGVYRITFVRFRIVPGHLLRVAVYVWIGFWGWSLAVAALTTSLIAGAVYLEGLGIGITFGRGWDRFIFTLHLIPPLAAIWSLFAAFQLYLRLPRAWLGTICSLTLTTVALVVLCVTMAVQVEGSVVGVWMEPLNSWIPGLFELVRIVFLRYS